MARAVLVVLFLSSVQGIGNGPSISQLAYLCPALLPPLDPLGTATANASGTASRQVKLPASPPLREIATQAIILCGPGGADSVATNTITAPLLASQ